MNFARMDNWSFWSGNMPAKTLVQMVADMDYPQDVRDAILNEVAKNGNEARIISGELTLPSRQDAIHWNDRAHGRYGLTEEQKVLEKRVQDLEAKLQAKTGGK